MVETSTRPHAHAWWKPTNDTLACYLSFDEMRRMLASSSSLAPRDWQEKARRTLGQRLGEAVKGTLRAGYSVATLGLSEIMFQLSKPGLLTGNEDLPPLDLVVGPTEAAILIVDGAVDTVLTAERLATHSAWNRLDRILGRGMHLEVVMLDTAPISLTIPLRVVLAGEEIQAEVDAEVAFGLEGADRILNALARGGSSLQGVDLNQSKAKAAGLGSFVTTAAIADQIQRRLEHRVASMQFSGKRTETLCEEPEALRSAELELHAYLAEELGIWGFSVSRCQLLLGRSETQQLAIDTRRAELAEERKTRLAEAALIDERRTARLETERQAITTERRNTELQAEGSLSQLEEGNRMALARMVLLDDQELSQIEREGFKLRRTDEREEEALDFRQEQLLLREQRKQTLEEQLEAAQTGLETSRIGIQLDREKLEIAGLAQDQNLTNLRQLKQIEREDDLQRQAAQADAERERLAAAKDLTPEQMMAALADKDPEIAKAMASRFSSEAEFARKSADEQKALMSEMQAQMSRLMEKGLDANAAVAGGLVRSTQTRGQSSAGACASCGEGTQATWKTCPFCGAALARA